MTLMKKSGALFGFVLFASILLVIAGLLFSNPGKSDLVGLASDQSVTSLARLPKCTNNSCISPPASSCKSGKLITYEIPGICRRSGKCDYIPISFDCPFGCSNGACIIKDECSSASIQEPNDDLHGKPGTNSFALFVNPIAKSESMQYALTFDKSLNVDVEKLARQMGNVVSYNKDGIILQLDSKNANPFMLTKLGSDDIRQVSFDGYIIELAEEPVLEKKAKTKKKIARLKKEIKELSESEEVSQADLNLLRSKRAEVDNAERGIEQELIIQENKIEQEQSRFVEDVSNTISKKRSGKIKDLPGQKKVYIKQKFKKTFNGVVIKDVSEHEISEIKKLRSVKRITPNFIASVNLQESVPIIRADKLWEIGLTGKGIRIGIIDTGVDYTHPDLSSCSGGGGGGGDSHAEATLKIGGRDYKVISSSDIGFNDFNIKVDISGDGVLPNFNLGDNFRDVIGSEKETITKDDYLFLKDFGMLQYKGADKATADNPLLKFKQLKTGNTTEQAYTNSKPLANLKLGGYDYSVFAASDVAFNDFDINTDLDHSGAIFDYGLGIIADESKDIAKDSNF